MRRVLWLCLLLGACTSAQIESTTAQIEAACAAALPLAGQALALPTIGPFIAAGVVAGCGTNAGIAKLAADPSSAQWLDQQAAALKKAVGRRPFP